MAVTLSSITTLRAAFGRCAYNGAHKQMGLRALRNAQQMLDSNPEYAAAQVAAAKTHLAYAEAC